MGGKKKKGKKGAKKGKKGAKKKTGEVEEKKNMYDIPEFIDPAIYGP